MKSVRVEKIDALIAELEHATQKIMNYENSRMYPRLGELEEQIKLLRGLEKESEEMISPFESRAKDSVIDDLQEEKQNIIENSIPLSAVEAKITKFQKELKTSNYDDNELFTETDRIKLLLWELEDLKNQSGIKKDKDRGSP